MNSYVSLDDWSEPKLNEEFYRKFGSKLKYISCGEDLDYNLFPNLHSIRETTFSRKSRWTEFKEFERIKYRNLRRRRKFVSEVLQKFHKIRHLGLILYTDNKKSVLNAFKEKSVLQNLIELKYYTYDDENGYQFLHSMKQLSEKFSKLKSIAFQCDLVKDFPNFRQHLSPLKGVSRVEEIGFGANISKP